MPTRILMFRHRLRLRPPRQSVPQLPRLASGLASAALDHLRVCLEIHRWALDSLPIQYSITIHLTRPRTMVGCVIHISFHVYVRTLTSSFPLARPTFRTSPTSPKHRLYHLPQTLHHLNKSLIPQMYMFFSQRSHRTFYPNLL